MSTENWELKKDLCRCCHSEGNFKNLAEPCKFLGLPEIYSDMLKDCFDIEMVPVSGLLCAVTYTICEGCISRLRDAAEFKKQVQNCEERFRDMYHRNVFRVTGGSILDVDVKQELPDTYQDDIFKEECSQDDNDDDDDYNESLDFTINEQEHEPDKEERRGKKKKSKKTEKSKRTEKVKQETDDGAENDGDKKKGHLEVDDYVTEGPGKDKNYTCKACETSYRRKSDLRNHINRIHLKEKFIKCQFCPERFMYHSQRKQHMHATHSPNTPEKFSCGNCHRQFKRKNTLAEHMMDMHIEKKCAHCHLKFPRKKYLFHMNEAHSVPMPTCGICGLRTLLQSALIRHQRNVHLNEKNKKCDICHKMFHSESNLRDHKITHERKKVFQCDVCEKTFARKEGFKDHYRIHTGERPFLCSVCDSTFVQRASLRTHTRSHHRDVRDLKSSVPK